MIGQKIAHYMILDQLGQGGMGVVYKAQDQKLNRTVAIKVLPPHLVGDEMRRRRFLQEALSAAAVTHPYIATIHEAGEENGTLYIVMEFVEGETLRARILRGALSPDEGLRIATEVAEGLASAHHSNVIHRDLKPENIMITKDGHAKILDFGLAKLLEPEPADSGASQLETAANQLTVHGEIMGTPAYMSPEQARGLELDMRSDIFTFGSILYESVSGQSPFQGPTRVDTLSAILHSDPMAPNNTAVVKPLVPELERILRKTLQKDREQRYQSTQDLVVDLRALSSDRASVIGMAPALPAAPSAKRRITPARLAAVLGGVAVLLAGALFFIRNAGRDRGATQTSDQAPGARAPQPPAVPAPRNPNWILVAELEAPAGQEALANAARELIVAALQQSEVVTPISPAQLEHGLRLAGKPPESRVRGELARELAVRASARSVVDGRIDRIGDSYSIVAHVTDVANRRLITSVNKRAAGESELVVAFDELGRELRQQLGEQQDAVGQTQPLRETITPSFQAYENYVRAAELQAKREFASSNVELRAALELDRDFGLAWWALGGNFSNLGFVDSARVAFDAALARKDRLTPAQQLGVQAHVADVIDNDMLEALRIYDQLLEESPFVASVHSNRGRLLFNLGRYEEALQAQTRAAEVRPFGTSTLQRNNQLLTLMQLGRFRDANDLAQQLESEARQSAFLVLAHAASRWASAESIAAASLAASPSATLRFQAELTRATVAVTRGDIATATGILARIIPQAPSPFEAHVAAISWTQLWIMGRTYLDAPPASVCAGATTPELIVQAIQAAAAGNTGAAQAKLQVVRTHPGPEQRRYAGDIKVAEAWVLASIGDWEMLIQQHQKSATAGQGPWFSGRIPIRWLLAEAHEILGQHEEAVKAFELVLSPLRMHHDTWTWWGMTAPFAHARLVVLYARLGETAQALEHWEALEASLGRPDAAVAGLFNQAARAVSRTLESAP